MQHVVLCGDSVFDNHAYVNPGEPDVVKQVRERLPRESTATLLAMDGDVVAGVEAQLMKLPKGATRMPITRIPSSLRHAAARRLPRGSWTSSGAMTSPGGDPSHFFNCFHSMNIHRGNPLALIIALTGLLGLGGFALAPRDLHKPPSP